MKNDERNSIEVQVVQIKSNWLEEVVMVAERKRFYVECKEEDGIRNGKGSTCFV